MFDLAQAAAWINAARSGDTARLRDDSVPARVIGDARVRISAVSSDTRSLAGGELFVALHGERFDGHDFVAQARAAGAAAALVDHWPLAAAPEPVIVAPDTRRALGELARGWRRQFSLPLIAVTGSNGKTTVKEMIAAILAQAVGELDRLATRGNLNNDIGVPLTLLRLRENHRYAVIELGMNHPGEIAYLSSIALPGIALVNNAQREHQEFMQSVQAVALENGAVLGALGTDGTAVFPGDDPHQAIWAELAGARRCLRFGFADSAEPRGGARLDVRASPAANPSQFELTLPDARTTVRLAIDGQHNVRNALAAAACCWAAGIAAATIADGLAAFTPVRGRLVRGHCAGGAALIDDSYNANPDSVRAAIDVLTGFVSPRVLILGDMGEVGRQGPRFHAEVGDYARERGVDALLALGEATRETVRAFGARGEHFDALERLVERARRFDAPGATLLIKGSRFMAMERVVQALAPPQPSSRAGH